MRPDKRAARFGPHYRHPQFAYLPVGFNLRKFAHAVQVALPAIHRMTATIRQMAENLRRAQEFEQCTQAVEAMYSQRDDRPLLDRIDDTLHSYDASRPDVHTNRPFGWI